MQQPIPVEAFDMTAGADGVPGVVDEIGIPVDDANVRVGSEEFRRRRDGAGGVGVVGIQPPQDVAAGDGEGIVDGVGLAAVGRESQRNCPSY